MSLAELNRASFTSIKTFLLTWDPARWDWQDLDDCTADVRAGTSGPSTWSCSNTKKPQPRDRFFLLVQGNGRLVPKGLIGSGQILTASFEGPHWDPDRAAAGDQTRHVRVKFDALLPRALVFPRAQLNVHPVLKAVRWSTQSSGIEIANELTDDLEALWTAHLDDSDYRVSIEPDVDSRLAAAQVVEGPYIERVHRQIERDRTIVDLAKAVWREADPLLKCEACGFSFVSRYGVDCVEAHYRKPFSELKGVPSVTSAGDLARLCANCHRVAHSVRPWFTVDQIKARLRDSLS